MPRSLMHGHVLVALRAEVLTHRCPSAPIVQQPDIYLFKQTVFPLSSTLSVPLCFVFSTSDMFRRGRTVSTWQALTYFRKLLL